MLDYLPKTEATGFFQEIRDLFAQTDQKFQDTDKKFQDTDKKFQDTNQKFQDTNQKFQDTDKKFQDTNQKFQDTDQKFQDTDKKFQDTDKQIKELKKIIGQLGGRLGDFVEEMVRPAVVRLFHGHGLNIHQVFQNVTKYDDQRQFVMEIDLLAVDTDTAVAIECKSHCSVEDVKEHVERLSMFKDCFPQYAEYHIYGAIAAMVMPNDTARYAYRQGLFVLAQSGDTIQIRNNSAFQPREW